MENLLVIIFIVSIVLALNTYVFYPIFIGLLAKQKREKRIKEKAAQKVSILISAYNEEKVILDRIKNIADSDYPQEKIEVLIGSDSSTDRTNEILLEQAEKYSRLKVFLFDERSGKAGVINKLVKEASNEILVFTDANTEFKENALTELISGFDNISIGGVSGKLFLTDKNLNTNESVEEKSYWDYEIKIKTAEGKLGILIGANGGIFAIRKKYFREIPLQKAVTDDLFITLSVLSVGKKFIYNPEAIAVEDIGSDVKTELMRKIRFAATNFQTLLFFKELLFHKNILLSFAFWSHKILRWFFPFVQISLLVTNILLIHVNQFFMVIIFVQFLFYLFALIGYYFSTKKKRVRLFSFPFFFVASNIAIIIGFIRFLRKKHSVIWQATSR